MTVYVLSLLVCGVVTVGVYIFGSLTHLESPILGSWYTFMGSLLFLEYSGILVGSPVLSFYTSKDSWYLLELLDSDIRTLVGTLLGLTLRDFLGFEPWAGIMPPRSDTSLGSLEYYCFGLTRATFTPTPRLESLTTGTRQRILCCLFQVYYCIKGEFAWYFICGSF